MEAEGLGWGREQEQEAGLEERPAVASGPWRSEEGLDGRQNRARWRIGRPSALKAGLGVWWRRVMASREPGRWAWMEMRVWKTSCRTPVAWECTGCFRRLSAHQQTNQSEGQDRTEGKEGKKAGRKQPSCTQEGKTAGQEREKEGGREEKREGGR